MRENLSLGLANNKCTEQFVHPRSHISAFGICKLGNLHTSDNSIFHLVSVAELDVLGSTLAEIGSAVAQW